jgi:hypothetical protein
MITVLAMLVFCLCVSLSCVGLYIAFNGPGMIFNSLANWLTIHLPEYVRKPLFDCLTCMGSFWTLLWWVAVFGFTFNWWLPFCVFIVVGTNAIATLFVSYIIEEDEQP